jgi:hypothetical protein
MPAATIDRLWDGATARPEEVAHVRLTREKNGLQVVVDAPLYNDPAPPGAVGRCPGLWNFEVVELFIVGEDDRYLEMEFGPRGHYLVLQFAGRRQMITDEIELDYRVRVAGDRWHATADVPQALVPDPALRWNAFAIHGRGSDRRYLAAHPVPGDRPDFHRIEAYPHLVW